MEIVPVPAEAAPRRSDRVLQPPQKLTYEYVETDDEDAEVSGTFVVHEPTSYDEALRDDDIGKCLGAMAEEMVGLRQHNTRSFILPLRNLQKVISCRWVYKVKPKTNATDERYKARLVARVFQQKQVIDFNETLAPVENLSSIRLLLGHAHLNNFYVYEVDVKNVFLNVNLLEDIYMSQPEVYVDPSRPYYVCKLNRTI